MSNPRAVIVACCLLLVVSCDRWAVPATLVGTWSGTRKVTVRFRPARGPFRFVSDTVGITISVRADGSVAGQVGGATLVGAWVLSNRGWLGRAIHVATDFRLEGRLQGTLFAEDPIPSLDIRAPFGVAGDSLAGTLFQKSGMGVFPMVDLRLVKQAETLP